MVAKGADEVAAKIRELAKENNVALLEAPALARALHKHTEIGDEIPEALYSAVAEVLAYVFQLRAFKQGRRQVSGPSDASCRCRQSSTRTTRHRKRNQTRITEHLDEQHETASLDAGHEGRRQRRWPRRSSSSCCWR